MVFATLRFLATGSIYSVVGEICGVDKATSCRAIDKVITAISELHHEFISMPTNLDEISEIRQGFYNICKFPRCIGALDCTHVRIQSPGGENAELFRNRKGFFSFNVQALCDSELIIRNVVCRWQGSAHDANIFKNSRLRARLENKDFGADSLIVGDSGYGIKNYLITPLANPHTPAEQLFNEAQIRTRNPIERCFGVWKRRFPILSLGIRQNIRKIERIIITTAILHNIACLMRDQLPQVNDEEEAAIVITNNVEIPIQQPMNAANVNNLTRHLLITEYFQRLL
ncbi:hypothetical protein RI129_004489 [Pyrocoelia pectoralis]|uniref:DDE Tnp4 domain-containing protein n=1 Tax=Pyrocoelia pectoralis TaxID=417401 RepID=A0AAN7ZGT3_9COLE